jgi:hypothetical protein
MIDDLVEMLGSSLSPGGGNKSFDLQNVGVKEQMHKGLKVIVIRAPDVG